MEVIVSTLSTVMVCSSANVSPDGLRYHIVTPALELERSDNATRTMFSSHDTAPRPDVFDGAIVVDCDQDVPDLL